MSNPSEPTLNLDRVEAQKTRDRAPDTAIAFIDPSIENYSKLLAKTEFESEIEAILLDSLQDGIEQITSCLIDRAHLNSIHIIAHASPGCLYLGSSELSLETLDRYSTQLRTWAKWGTSRDREDNLLPSICSPSPVSFTLPLPEDSDDSDDTLPMLADFTPHLFLYSNNIAIGDAGAELTAKLQQLTGRKIVVNPCV